MKSLQESPLHQQACWTALSRWDYHALNKQSQRLACLLETFNVPEKETYSRDSTQCSLLCSWVNYNTSSAIISMAFWCIVPTTIILLFWEVHTCYSVTMTHFHSPLIILTQQIKGSDALLWLRSLMFPQQMQSKVSVSNKQPLASMTTFLKHLLPRRNFFTKNKAEVCINT